MENQNIKWKPEAEVVFDAILAKTDFLGFSRANISVAMGVTRPIFGAVPYVWGLNIPGKFQGHSSQFDKSVPKITTLGGIPCDAYG